MEVTFVKDVLAACLTLEITILEACIRPRASSSSSHLDRPPPPSPTLATQLAWELPWRSAPRETLKENWSPRRSPHCTYPRTRSHSHPLVKSCIEVLQIYGVSDNFFPLTSRMVSGKTQGFNPSSRATDQTNQENQQAKNASTIYSLQLPPPPPLLYRRISTKWHMSTCQTFQTQSYQRSGVKLQVILSFEDHPIASVSPNIDNIVSRATSFKVGINSPMRLQMYVSDSSFKN